jgi:iron(III) transport system substrate-binding protein
MDKLGARRAMAVVGLCQIAMGLAAMAPVRADEIQDLAAAAAKKPPVVWYESSEPGQIAKVAAEFNKRYPDIKVQFVQNTGGNTLAARVIQESRAGGQTASLISGDTVQLDLLAERDLMVKRDWTRLGVDKALAPAPHLVGISASIYVALWNKTKLSEAEAPKAWTDLLADRFKGKVGSWVRPPFFVQLAKAYGEQPARDIVERLANMNPMLFQSTFSLAQQVGSGEIDVGYGIYHTSQPTIAAGAPVGYRFLDPVPYDTIWAGVVNTGGNPEGGQVLLGWLGSTEGAVAYEAATGRGNPNIKGTKAAALMQGHQTVSWSYEETATYQRLGTEFAKILARGGKTN